jgi:CRP-like cAMP-binding protein
MAKNSLFRADEYDPNFIREISLFSGLAEVAKDALLKGGQTYSFHRGKSLFRQGDALGNFYVVCSGIVQVSRVTPDGHEVTLDILIAGDMTCAKEIFELSAVHMVNAAAVSDTVVMSFPRSWLLEAAQKNSVFALNLLSAISRMARMVELDAEHQATMSASQLLACFLMHLCVRYNFDPRGFHLPLSKSLIASRLGMELETLSRTLPVLEKYGITVKGKQVAFHDLPGINAHACDHCSVRDSCQARLSLRKKEAASVF